MSEVDPIVTISDIRPFFCVKGVRKAFAAGGGDFDHFLRHGMPASELRGKGFDAQLDRVLDAIRSRAS
ncbi:hypothetical protein AGRO_3653 [Agrobacterium sp. ATCC 31749]|uniref:Uncharacterized protein n=1 Tax=Agrobacterium fabrum TaxID=1176649 RepID=A0A7Z7BHL0_9HYPH|nr:hypothetical protein [Agrobacterium fabrum]EGL63584.1 hypothetical protein AGRO_3653 [Agrobacterium sp. ATCC 31749]SDJ25069.1 hypothetical protein SAMN05428983_0821 [Agrobacterium fabrum]